MPLLPALLGRAPGRGKEKFAPLCPGPWTRERKMCMTSFVRQEEEVSPPTVTCSHLQSPAAAPPEMHTHTWEERKTWRPLQGGTLSGNERKNTLRIDYSLLLQLHKHMQWLQECFQHLFVRIVPVRVSHIGVLYALQSLKKSVTSRFTTSVRIQIQTFSLMSYKESSSWT